MRMCVDACLRLVVRRHTAHARVRSAAVRVVVVNAKKCAKVHAHYCLWHAFVCLFVAHGAMRMGLEGREALAGVWRVRECVSNVCRRAHARAKSCGEMYVRVVCTNQTEYK